MNIPNIGDPKLLNKPSRLVQPQIDQENSTTKPRLQRRTRPAQSSSTPASSTANSRNQVEASSKRAKSGIVPSMVSFKDSLIWSTALRESQKLSVTTTKKLVLQHYQKTAFKKQILSTIKTQYSLNTVKEILDYFPVVVKNLTADETITWYLFRTWGEILYKYSSSNQVAFSKNAMIDTNHDSLFITHVKTISIITESILCPIPNKVNRHLIMLGSFSFFHEGCLLWKEELIEMTIYLGLILNSPAHLEVSWLKKLNSPEFSKFVQKAYEEFHKVKDWSPEMLDRLEPEYYRKNVETNVLNLKHKAIVTLIHQIPAFTKGAAVDLLVHISLPELTILHGNLNQKLKLDLPCSISLEHLKILRCLAIASSRS